MRTPYFSLILFVAAALAFGQQPGSSPGEAESATQEQAASSTDTSAPQSGETTVSHDPRVEQVLTGEIEVGYRAITGVAGDFNTYRSVVNLGEGPRLTHIDLSFAPPDQGIANEIRVQADSWGGDPYNTFRIDAKKNDVYRFHADYSNLMYFNFLPSFANPLIQQGVLVNQRSYDTFNRNTNLLLELRPGKRIIPFFGYGRSTGAGTGITPIVFSNNNEYPIGNQINYHSQDFRGGVRFEFDKWHITLEQGGTTFKDDQGTYYLGSESGNRSTPYLGQDLVLNGASQAYRVRGTGLYEVVNGSATPFDWMTLTGQFLYSQPKTDVSYSEVAGGNLTLNNPFLFFSALQGTAMGTAKMPHPSGDFTVEIRPHSRLRIMESLFTDRMHNSTYGLASGLLFPENITTTASLDDRLDYTYNRQQVDVIFDAARFLTVRGGWRYEWGESTVRSRSYVYHDPLETAKLRRHVARAGFVLRPFEKLKVTTSYERATSDKAYFRTSLNDYHRLRTQARYQVLPSLFFGAGVWFNQNENPSPGIGLDQQYTSYSASINWLPNNAKRISLIGEYMHSYFRSDLSYIAGPYFATEYSRYRDNANSATGLVALNLPSIGAGSPRIDVGGSLFMSSGSRPMDYYQPMGRVSVPIQKWMTAFGEWRWYGMSQSFYQYEGFRTHQFLVGFRWNM